MVNNIKRGLEKLPPKSFVFYCEDHIGVKHIPKEQNIQTLFDVHNVGWVCFNTHMHEQNLLNVPEFVEKPGAKQKEQYLSNSKNWLVLGEDKFLVKSKQFYDEYHINFPAAITRVKTFKKLICYAEQHYKDVGIEIGLTKAWFNLPELSALKVVISASWEKIPTTLQELHDCANILFRNNDCSKLHASVVEHSKIPEHDKNKRAFF
jgi:hypothetical protein